ncbi:hypothetical protein ADN00_18120 [Ornatilinea apprima]|uniref:Phosphotyrosine protein phosphatase I domain-containing protein n=1 Tax=Ornatilinea apprima TaxID=1134406 RepID=A0A0P6XGF2_9CHLR|nr:hypothetical protein ADN00_18120 [Ornatilinea apprima]
MAEAIVNDRMADIWQAVSAGTQPAGYIHPNALLVLREIGIDHRGFSKSVDDFRDIEFDLVVTVCDDAAETCPMWLGRGKKVHMGFIDPAKAVGSEEEVLVVFRSVRDQILEKIPQLLRENES